MLPIKQTSKYTVLLLIALTLACADTIWEKGVQTGYIIEANSQIPTIEIKTHTGGQNRAYKPLKKRTIYAKVTKYTKIETCPKRQCRTANGEIPYRGKVAACPRSIHLNKRIAIGGQYYKCTDHTNLRFDGRFDLYAGSTQTDYREAKEWGIKVLKVTILE